MVFFLHVSCIFEHLWEYFYTFFAWIYNNYRTFAPDFIAKEVLAT